MSDMNSYGQEFDSEFADMDGDVELTDEISSIKPPVALESTSASSSSSSLFVNESCSWEYRSKLAPFEVEKEYAVFKLWLESGSGRSKQYISKVYNYPESTINKIALKNNWGQRATDFDCHQLQLMQAAENTRRAQEHKRKLEEYRLQQEFIGRSLSSDAAKLAAIVSSTLDKFMMSDREIDIRDLPAVLNAANKAAEVGRNLQSSSLGVDQLLTALEEVDD